jgi:nucleotide-binding universal stress UspA family protein
MLAIKNILVATDFSDASRAALEYGRELAKGYGATLHVLHVVDDIRWRYSLDMTAVDVTAVQESLEDSARTQLSALVTEEDRRQLKLRTRVFTATSAADSLVQYAAAEHCDLIVVGTHGRTGLRRFVMGSVAERIVRSALCPVLTVRQPLTSLPAAPEAAEEKKAVPAVTSPRA